jgi:transcriptional regulator with XRE-family HTH domain
MFDKKMLGQRIRQHRDQIGYSQDDLATYLSIPRPSVSQIENGQRSVDGSELVKLAELFQVSVDELLKGGSEGKNQPQNRNVQKVIGDLNESKFKEVLLYILERVGAKSNVGLTVLYKLMYFSDFDFYEKYGRHLTGANYRKIEHGPAPTSFDNIVSQMIDGGEITKVVADYHGKAQKRYLPLRRADVSSLSGTEVQVIDAVLSRHSDKNATEISEYSHGDAPWQKAKMGELLDYQDVSSRTASYSSRTSS